LVNISVSWFCIYIYIFIDKKWGKSKNIRDIRIEYNLLLRYWINIEDNCKRNIGIIIKNIGLDKNIKKYMYDVVR
jgi:hypothetical protein